MMRHKTVNLSFHEQPSMPRQVEHLQTFLQVDATKHGNSDVDQTIREHLRQVTAQSNEIMG